MCTRSSPSGPPLSHHSGTRPCSCAVVGRRGSGRSLTGSVVRDGLGDTEGSIGSTFGQDMAAGALLADTDQASWAKRLESRLIVAEGWSSAWPVLNGVGARMTASQITDGREVFHAQVDCFVARDCDRALGRCCWRARLIDILGGHSQAGGQRAVRCERSAEGCAEALGKGAADFTITGSKVCWDFTISGIGKPPCAVHIHRGRAGTAGPVVVPLGAAYRQQGCTTAPGRRCEGDHRQPEQVLRQCHHRAVPQWRDPRATRTTLTIENSPSAKQTRRPAPTRVFSVSARVLGRSRQRGPRSGSIRAVGAGRAGRR